jgi:hypothetical protein
MRKGITEYKCAVTLSGGNKLLEILDCCCSYYHVVAPII